MTASTQLSHTRILAITSGKGGVGKSTVTVNLAVALAQRGHDVAVLDADVYGFSVPKMLGTTDIPVQNEAEEAGEEGTLLVPPVAHGVKCVSLGFFIDDEQPVMWRGPMLHKALAQFLNDVDWGSPEFLLVDMPPGTGDVAISMAEYVPQAEVFVVTTPQPAAQRVAQRTGMMARELEFTVGGVIENMSWFVGEDGERYELFGSGGGEALAAQLSTELLVQLPLFPALREGGDVGVPIVASQPDTEVAFLFDQLGASIEKQQPRRHISLPLWGE